MNESEKSIIFFRRLGTRLWMMKLMSHQYWLRVYSLVIDSTMSAKRKRKKIVPGFFFSSINSMSRERWVTSSHRRRSLGSLYCINTIYFDGGMKSRRRRRKKSGAIKKWRGERKTTRTEEYISHFVHCLSLFWTNRKEKKKQKSIVLDMVYYIDYSYEIMSFLLKTKDIYLKICFLIKNIKIKSIFNWKIILNEILIFDFKWDGNTLITSSRI
jgi:hypothetical protein